MRIAVDPRRSVAERRHRSLFFQGPIIKTLVTVEATIHLLAAQHEHQTLEDIIMRGTADRFALTFWTDVFSSHCEGQGILPFDSKPPRLRRERGHAGSVSGRDVERGFPAFVVQVN
jgi:hypothetical protein